MDNETPHRANKHPKTGAHRLRRRLGLAAAALETAFSRAYAWWRHYWLRVTGVVLAIVLISVVKVAVDVGSRPVRGTSGLIRQMMMFIAALNALIAYPVAMATMYYAKRSGQLTDLEEKRTADARLEKRRGVVHALIGSAMEVAAFAAWVAELQHQGNARRLPGESAAERAFALEGWKLLSTAVARVSGNLERVRLETPDLTELASPLFESAVAALEVASQGDVPALERRADEIREQVRHLRAAVLASEPRSTGSAA